MHAHTKVRNNNAFVILFQPNKFSNYEFLLFFTLMIVTTTAAIKTWTNDCLSQFLLYINLVNFSHEVRRRKHVKKTWEIK